METAGILGCEQDLELVVTDGFYCFVFALRMGLHGSGLRVYGVWYVMGIC